MEEEHGFDRRSYSAACQTEKWDGHEISLRKESWRGEEVPLDLRDSIYQQEKMLAEEISDVTEVQKKYL